MARDVICGMSVKEDSEIRSTFSGKTYYFCSENCKVEFDKNPIKYTR